MKLILLILIFSFCLSINPVNAAEQAVDVGEVKTLNVKSDSKGNNNPTIQQAVLGMNVSGNKELPNVLYIVPWKNNQKNNIDNKPSQNIMLDEIFAPIDPQAFAKKVKFYQQITSTVENNK